MKKKIKSVAIKGNKIEASQSERRKSGEGADK